MKLQEHLAHDFADNSLGQGSEAFGRSAPLPDLQFLSRVVKSQFSPRYFSKFLTLMP